MGLKSFDIIGKIALIDVPKNLSLNIGKKLLEENKYLVTVVRKISKTGGKNRVLKVSFVCGKKNFTTIHKENGIFLKLKIGSVYFSPRLSTERLRVVNQINSKELVLDLFSGVGPFSVPIAKKGGLVSCVEWNKRAFNFLQENFKLNKVKGNLFNVDAKFFKSEKKFDRIIMNHPSKSFEFLSFVLKNFVKKNTVIHFYCFGNEWEFINDKDMFKNFEKKILKIAKNYQLNIIFLEIRKTAQTSARSYRLVFDIKIK